MMRFFKRIVQLALFVGVLGFFTAVAYVIYRSGDDEVHLKALLLNDEKRVTQAFFSPDDNLRSILISLIDSEKQGIVVAMYTFTDKAIASALVQAVGRGVSVECIVDRYYATDRYSKIHLLANASIPIWVYQPSLDPRASSLMHNKFCIFEDSIEHHTLVWTGSYNFTIRANERNQENVVIVDAPQIIEKFKKQFGILKGRSLQISGKIQSLVDKQHGPESSWFKTLFS